MSVRVDGLMKPPVTFGGSCGIMRTMRNMLVFLIMGVVATSAMAQRAVNLLQDPSFEEALYEPFSTNWSTWGGTSCEAVTPRSRSFVAKLFGMSRGEVNHSGVFQDVPAVEGKRYIASAWFRQNGGDTLQGDNEAWVKLEFWGESGMISKVQSPTRLRAKDAANKYVFISTGPVKAPAGTTKARFVAIFKQGADNARGAVLVDDAELREVP